MGIVVGLVIASGIIFTVITLGGLALEIYWRHTGVIKDKDTDKPIFS